MARISHLNLSERRKVSDDEKVQLDAQKIICAAFDKGGPTGLDTLRIKLNQMFDIIGQTGNGKGKRFKGAMSHDDVDQVTALADITFNKRLATVE